MRRAAERDVVVAMALIVLALAGACSSTSRSKHTSDPKSWAVQAEVDGDFDKAEERWRREIAANPWSEDDMNLLTDDPPPGAVESGAVAVGNGEQVASAETADEDDGFWGKFGKASFSAFTVLFTVGMAVAPYLLL
jgi:hypothetical protein